MQQDCTGNLKRLKGQQFLMWSHKFLQWNITGSLSNFKKHPEAQYMKNGEIKRVKARSSSCCFTNRSLLTYAQCNLK